MSSTIEEIMSDIENARKMLQSAEENNDREMKLKCIDLLNTLMQKEMLLQQNERSNSHDSVNKIAIKNMIRDVMSENESISFSTCSDGILRNFLRSIGVEVDTGDDFECVEPPSEFKRFDWINHDEDKETASAVTHIQTQLQNFGISFGRDHFQMYDVHSNKSLLNVENIKLGKKLRGGTDVVIGPYGKHIFSVVALVVRGTRSSRISVEEPIDVVVRRRRRTGAQSKKRKDVKNIYLEISIFK